MVYEARMEIRQGLSEANRAALDAMEKRAAGAGLSDADRGALAAFRMHATGEDLARVDALKATKPKAKK